MRTAKEFDAAIAEARAALTGGRAVEYLLDSPPPNLEPVCEGNCPKCCPQEGSEARQHGYKPLPLRRPRA